jgi:Spx/MgsR family transcriptional regulator
MVVMYGIKNCDTIKKARRWLEANGVEYRFHDYRADGLDAEFLHSAIGELGGSPAEHRGTTWRKLDESARQHQRRRQRGKTDARDAGNYQTPIALRARAAYAAGFQ